MYVCRKYIYILIQTRNNPSKMLQNKKTKASSPHSLSLPPNLFISLSILLKYSSPKSLLFPKKSKKFQKKRRRNSTVHLARHFNTIKFNTKMRFNIGRIFSPLFFSIFTGLSRRSSSKSMKRGGPSYLSISI